jgi:hypothetical protein
MLGNSADHFFLGQMTERVVAHPSNAKGQSMQVPDRERAGTARVAFKNQEMPGPQRQVSSGYMPGMGSVPTPPAPPRAGGALPGMGSFNLAGIEIDTGTLAVFGGLAFAVWYFGFKKS